VTRVLISALLWPLALAYFLGYLLLALVLSYLLPFRTIDPFLKSLNRGLFRLLFIRVQVRGLEDLDSEKTYIYIANGHGAWEADSMVHAERGQEVVVAAFPSPLLRKT